MFVTRIPVCLCAVCIIALAACRAQSADTSVWQLFHGWPSRPAPTLAAGAAFAPPMQVPISQSVVSPSSAPLSPIVLHGTGFEYPAYENCVVSGDPHHSLAVPLVDPAVASATPGGLFELLPSDVIWHSYWAGAKESRTSAIALEEFSDEVSLLDVSLGGRTAIFRNASQNHLGQWRGWELQIEGAAILRLNLDQDWDFDAADFRFGVPLIFARNQWHYKLAYYHLSSHVGDEFLVRNPGFTRINFSRDVLVGGASYFPLPGLRLYGETGYAFYEAEGSDQWEFQFGFDLARPGPTGALGTPFLAMNGHLREEVDFGGNLAVQTGWLWRGETGRVLRTGLHYYNGKSPQYEFFDTFEQQLGLGLWQEY